MKKIKSNIVLIILGFLFILISLTIGYLNLFSGDQGFIYMLIGVPLLTIGIVFTPTIWERLGYVMDMIFMFFSR